MKYIKQKNKNHPYKLPIDDLIEAMKVHDAPFNNNHYNHIKAYMMQIQNNNEFFEEEDLDKLFSIPFEVQNPFDFIPKIDLPLII